MQHIFTILNKHFTLKENPLKRSDLDDFVACYNPKNRHQREESERFKNFTYEELARRDKANLDIFWLKDESLEDSTNLPEPGVFALEIMDDLEAALEQFATIAEDLKKCDNQDLIWHMNLSLHVLSPISSPSPPLQALNS